MQLVAPHSKLSRIVIEADLELVKKQASTMQVMCRVPRGLQSGALALAHSQFEGKDPLRFFVMGDGEIVVNPEMTRHSSYVVKREEGCYSYATKEYIMVDRYQKCEVKYNKIVDGKLEEVEESLSGTRAEIFQHEIDHMQGKYIYDNS